MLAGPNPHEGDKAPAFTGSLYFHTDDVDGLWQRLKDKARICYPIDNFEYVMRESPSMTTTATCFSSANHYPPRPNQRFLEGLPGSIIALTVSKKKYLSRSSTSRA